MFLLLQSFQNVHEAVLAECGAIAELRLEVFLELIADQREQENIVLARFDHRRPVGVHGVFFVAVGATFFHHVTHDFDLRTHFTFFPQEVQVMRFVHWTAFFQKA